MTDWPSTTAGFPGSCKECNAEWKKGTKIYGINADTELVKRWCSNANCPDSAGVPPPKPKQEEGQPLVSKSYSAAVGILTPAAFSKHQAAWLVALEDAAVVHPQDNSEAVRAKYILACVFYKGLMGVT